MKYNLKPLPGVVQKKVKININGHRISMLVLHPEHPVQNAPGVLWLHGGGYMLGMKEMVHMSRAESLILKFGAVVIAPGYHLSFLKPYPAAINECYAALLWVKGHANELGIDPCRIMVGGESAGGGLAAALCMMARDKGEVNIAFQMPLYPMLDNYDTESSRDNHNKVWNTRLNHLGWRLYLRRAARDDVSPYAAPARQIDYSELPPAYTFCCTDEPFYAETVAFVDHLKAAGVEAGLDIYKGLYHAFDLMEPETEISRLAASRFEAAFAYAMEHYSGTEKSGRPKI